MFFTKKGDDGKTKIFGCDQRFSKNSVIAEALGALDEINSFLGVCKAENSEINSQVFGEKTSEIINNIQENLFIIQAQIAGSDKKVTDEKILNMEEIISNIEKFLPPIKTFLISGGNKISAEFDFARTLARKAERRVVAVKEENLIMVDKNTLIYLNRLSSLLYALARFFTEKDGQKESSPSYS